MRTLLFAGLIAVCCLLILWGAGLWYFLRLMPQSDLPGGRYDAVIALTGGKNRIATAVALLERGQAGELFISGVEQGFTMADLERDIAPDFYSAISFGKRARSTIGNAEETADWLAEKDYQDVLIVSANYHMPRVRLLFSAYLPEYGLHYAAVDPPDFQRRRWWQHGNSRRLVLLEYHKWLITLMQLRLGMRG